MEKKSKMKDAIKNHFQNNFSEFYQKYLPKIKKIGGDEYQATCPFHDDTKPSFNFNNSTGAYFCHGCGKKGGHFHFYAKINGLHTKKDFRKILKGIAADFGIPLEEQKSKMVKAYDYLDAEGNLLFQVCRMEPKSFRQRRPNGSGGWIWNLKGIQPVPYRLTELDKADEVIIVEGEKDCDNLAKLSIVATTCPMGAKKWRDEYNEYLKGKKIVLIPDNDNEGREHMAQIGASLNGQTANLKLLEMPGLASKGDVSDFIARFKDKDEAAERLSIMIENAPPYVPPKTYSHEDVVCSTSGFKEIKVDSRQSLLMPFLKEHSNGLVYGPRGSGKTWLALGVLDAVSKGEKFGPWECEKSVPCMLVDGEMTISDIQERIDDLNLADDRKNPFLIYSDHHANQLGLSRARLTSNTWRSKMKSILTARGVKLWVLDNIASLAPNLDENKKQDWDDINQYLLDLRFSGISTILLHHESKEGRQRGTSAREDNLDYSIRLKYPSDYTPEDGCRFIVHFTKARVKTADLNLISDTEFKLDQDENGQTVWMFKNVRAERKVEVIKMLDDGFDQKTIAEALSISSGRVSQIKKRAVKDGLITAKGKMTQSGFLYVSDAEKN
jgi:5S rRNA maturation endonuclease (ribonuclease M5)